jgi:hypothetical protein
MPSQIQISSPFLRTFVHANVTVGTSISEILPLLDNYKKRVTLIIQNKSSTATIQVILSSTDTTGIEIPPKGNLNVDNYNGSVRCVSSAAATTVHVAYSEV